MAQALLFAEDEPPTLRCASPSTIELVRESERRLCGARFAVAFRTACGDIVWLTDAEDWSRNEGDRFLFSDRRDAEYAVQRDSFSLEPLAEIPSGLREEPLTYAILEVRS